MQTVLFPYSTLTTAPSLSLTNPTVDGEPQQLLAREGNIDLFGLTRTWREARVNLRVQVPMDELSQIGATEPSVVATVNCGPTNLRIARQLEASGSGQWTGHVDLPRTLISRHAELYVTVAGTVAGEPNRWLGRSRGVQVNLEPPRSVDIGGGEMPVIWRDFSEVADGQNPIDVALHAEVSYVDLNASDGPVIYLNERVEHLRQLLHDRTGRSRVERVCRDLVFDGISSSALAGMFNAGLAAARDLAEADEPQFPSTDWQRGVLEALLPLMYPDREPQAALSEAVNSMTSGDDAQDMQARLIGAVGRHVRAASHTVQTIRVLEALDEED